MLFAKLKEFIHRPKGCQCADPSDITSTVNVNVGNVLRKTVDLRLFIVRSTDESNEILSSIMLTDSQHAVLEPVCQAHGFTLSDR